MNLCELKDIQWEPRPKNKSKQREQSAHDSVYEHRDRKRERKFIRIINHKWNLTGIVWIEWHERTSQAGAGETGSAV